MKDIFAWVTFLALTVSAYMSLAYAVRRRRSASYKEAYKNRALMNIALGVMLFSLGTILTISDNMSTVRAVVIGVFGFFGAVNLIAGIIHLRKNGKMK